jgi:uncharacterized protein (TIGR03435 family)
LIEQIGAIIKKEFVSRLNSGKKLALAVIGLAVIEMAALAVPVVIGMLNAPSAGAQLQPVAARPEFEVATVKANNSQTDSSNISGVTPGRFTASNTPLRFIILYGYQLLDHQLIGAPDWTASTGFDIAATYPAGQRPTDREVRSMVQNLLGDRFRLTAHREQREGPMYALIFARKDGRLGPRIRRSDVDCEKWIADKRPQVGTGGPSAVAPGGMRPACMMVATRRYLTRGTRTMEQLAVTLQSMVGRPVVDRTGLTGAFDVDLQWTPERDADAAAGGNTSTANDGPSIFTAVQEQLGLKLESQRGQFDALVIDHVERPTAN